jgi:phage terminase large subunit
VQTRLRPAGDGKPRLFILRDSVVERDTELEDARKPTSTADEISGYVWAIKPGGDLKEEPVKENDHGADCTRYLVAERDLGGRPRVRWLG